MYVLKSEIIFAVFRRVVLVGRPKPAFNKIVGLKGICMIRDTLRLNEVITS